MTNLSSKRVLVTGGAGYIGQHVVRAFQEAGADVEVWDIKKPEVIQPYDHAKYEIVDIFDDYHNINHFQTEKHFDVVVNLAAISNVPDCEAAPDRAWEVNYYGMRFVLNCAEKWKARFLQADSAMSPFGNLSGVGGAGVYADTKHAANRLVKASRSEGHDSHNLTLYNVAGAHPDASIGENHKPETHFIPNLVLAHLNKTPFRIEKSHNITRDFVHVCDVASAFTKAACQDEIIQHSIDVGRGESTSLAEVVEIARACGLEIETEEFESGRFEPTKQAWSKKFEAYKLYWVNGWTPKYTITDMINDQLDYASRA
jgi:UDP-glucose 4-epimerase